MGSLDRPSCDGVTPFLAKVVSASAPESSSQEISYYSYRLPSPSPVNVLPFSEAASADSFSEPL